MDQIIPLKTLMKPIREHYPKAGNVRHPIGLDIMLRIYYMQQWYGLIDPAMEGSLYGIALMRRFVGFDLELIPDESTILNSRIFWNATDGPRRCSARRKSTWRTKGLMCGLKD